MFRFVLSFCLLPLFLCSVGCRMCCTPYDYCISTYIDRPDDYRDCGPLYRAGSILSGEYGMCQTDGGEIMFVGDSEGFYGNAGNYGITTPVSIVQQTEPVQNPPLAKPQGNSVQPPSMENPVPGPYSDPGNTIPSVEELIDMPRRNTVPEPMNQVPVTPPARQKIGIPSFEDTPTETIPFSPSDTVPQGTEPQDAFPTTPSLPMPTEGEPPITLEELRRLDPSVQDIQIISIEEAAADSSVY